MKEHVHARATVTMTLRLVLGAVVVGLLGYVWLASTTGYLTLLVATLLGVGGGVIMGSWWSVPSVPVVLFLSVRISHMLRCRGCPMWSEDDTSVTLILLSTILYGAAALGATIGVLASRSFGSR